MKILICGSEGRLMSAVIPHLIQAGHELTGVDTCEKWGHADTRRGYYFVRGNCADPVLMGSLMKGVEGVIQAAATLAGVVGFHRRPADILANDVTAHAVTLQAARAAGAKRVVFISSSMVYERCSPGPLEESLEDLPLPQTDYGLSKLMGERLSRAFAQQCGLPFTIWRPFNIIDPSECGSDDAGVSHVFADFIHRLVIRQQNPLHILGDGRQVRSFLHIREAGEAIGRFSFEPSTLNETMNLGSPEMVTMRQLAERIYNKASERHMIEHAGPLTIQPTPVFKTDVKQRVGSFEKIKGQLGWRVQVTLDQALDECLDLISSSRISQNASPSAVSTGQMARHECTRPSSLSS